MAPRIKAPAEPAAQAVATRDLPPPPHHGLWWWVTMVGVVFAVNALAWVTLGSPIPAAESRASLLPATIGTDADSLH